jgi:hypothetical protein
MISGTGGADEFISGVQILNLKTEELTMIWDSPTVGFVPEVGREYYLGTLEFKANGTGEANVGFMVKDSAGNKTTLVQDLAKHDILKSVDNFKISIE